MDSIESQRLIIRPFVLEDLEVIHPLKITQVFAVPDRENAASKGVTPKLGMRLAHNPDASVVYPTTAGVLEVNGESQ